MLTLRFVGLVTLVACMVGTSLSATAAVRQCQAGVTSAIVTGATERAGKQRALLSWTVKAFKFGVGYASWRLADTKVLGCTRGKTSGDAFSCVAYARPCTIQQNPQMVPRPGKPAVPKYPQTNGRAAPVEI